MSKSDRKIDAELIYYFIERLQRQGLSCDRLILEAGLSEAIAARQKWIPLTAWDRFIDLCSQAPLPQPFSLMAASWIVDLDALNQLEGDKRKAAFIYLLRSASTISGLLEQIDRFHCLLTLPTRPRLAQEKTFVAVYDDTLEGYHLSATSCELVFATWLLYIKRFWVDKYQLLDHLRVQFRHSPPQSLEPYHEVFGRHLTFNGPRNEIHFPSGFGELQFIESDRTLYQLMIVSIESVFAEQQQSLEENSKLCIRCAALLRDNLPEELLNIDQLAESFHMSVSTLRRRLRDEGYSYRKLVDEIRQQLALNYTNKPTISPDEVVKNLGFYDYSAMNKAFQRWFSKSPVEFYRK